MLRFLITISLRLLIIFTGMGLLLSHQWGWSEYASPELYVVYRALIYANETYSTVNANGNGESERLKTNLGTITALNCSPDGHTLAFLVDAHHLYVVTSSGIEYNRNLEGTYYDLSVANDKTVAASSESSPAVLINSTSVRSLVPHSSSQSYRVAISSQGNALWSDDNSENSSIEIYSPNETEIVKVPRAYYGVWLAIENIFTFTSPESSPLSIKQVYGQYLMDSTTQVKFRLKDWMDLGQISPDGTKVGVSMPRPHSMPAYQIYVADYSSHGQWQQLTYDPDTSVIFQCFLTFRPQMLIADKQ